MNPWSLLVFLGIFAGCATAPPEEKAPEPVGRPQKPYTINGVTYYPLASAKGYKEKGIASWYGYPFHGRPTANGETYDMHRNTAAHTILPLGTPVRVTNLENGRVLLTRINDRGPFVKNRLIDLSLFGAEQLEMQNRGTAPVLVEAIDEPAGDPPLPKPEKELAEDKPMPQPPPVAAGNPRYFIQVGAFQEQGNASALAKRLRSVAKTDIQSVLVNQQRFYRVRLGPVASIEQADLLVEELTRVGITSSQILVE